MIRVTFQESGTEQVESTDADHVLYIGASGPLKVGKTHVTHLFFTNSPQGTSETVCASLLAHFVEFMEQKHNMTELRNNLIIALGGKPDDTKYIRA
jgi:hypothetical protein